MPPPASNVYESSRLGRLASAAFRHRRRAVSAWLVILIAAVAGGLTFSGKYVADYSTPGSDSKAAANILESQFGGRTAQTVDIVYHDQSSVSRPAVVARVNSLLGAAGKLTGLNPAPAAQQAQVSPDGRTAIVSIPLNRLKDKVPPTTGQSLLALANRDSGDGLKIAVGGQDVGQGTSASSISEFVGIGVAMVVLLLMFGGIIAAGLPLLTALFGLGIAVMGVGVMAATLPTPSWALQVASMIGLGVGIDYALLILTRHRAAMARGLDSKAATVESMSTAGRSVLIAGATVVVSLLGLFLMGLPYLYGIALSASFAVLIMLAATITLLPALLGFIGPRIDRLKIPGMNRAVVNPDTSRAARWAKMIQRRPLLAGVASIALLLFMATPVTGIRFGFPDAGNDPVNSTIRVAYDLVAKGFGPGANGPLIAVASTPDVAAKAKIAPLASRLRAERDVLSVSPPQPSRSGATTLLSITPKTSPQAKATRDLISRLRSGPLRASGLNIKLGGQTASVVDQGTATAKRLPLFIGGVILVSFMLLLAAFRAPVIALKAGVMNLLSIGAAYGVVAVVAEGGAIGQLVGINGNLPVPPFIPVMMFATLFGLSMDYEVFLMSRIREERERGANASEATVKAVARTARVITAAAAIMVAVFASFAISPEDILKLIGIGLASSILIDATIVRMILVPAVMELLGERSWWTPRWLDRILPDIPLEATDAAPAPEGLPNTPQGRREEGESVAV